MKGASGHEGIVSQTPILYWAFGDEDAIEGSDTAAVPPARRSNMVRERMITSARTMRKEQEGEAKQVKKQRKDRALVELIVSTCARLEQLCGRVRRRGCESHTHAAKRSQGRQRVDRKRLHCSASRKADSALSSTPTDTPTGTTQPASLRSPCGMSECVRSP